MKLSVLTEGNPYIPPEWDREINDIRIDSRDVLPGDLFIARRGSRGDGREHIDAALANGAAAVLAEGPLGFECGAAGVPLFFCSDLPQRLNSWLLRRYPLADNLALIAVTGTNGKSSVTQYIAQLATLLQQSAGLIGTLGNGIWPELQPTRNTTPDLSVILQSLTVMQQQQVSTVAMEVSSHGIDQQRIAGLSFTTAVMTNLTQDHLDYHGDMEGYFDAKARLFRDYPLQQALINVDDDYGRRLLQDNRVQAARYSYGQADDADVCYQTPEYRDGWLTTLLSTPWGSGELRLPLIGDFNVANAVAAIAVLCLQGLDFTALIGAASRLQAVDGRMELYQRELNGRRQLAVVDFAHTADALHNVMHAVRNVAASRALVFGCGGDRDRGKRPQMAAAALASGAQVWLTDDNPRSEDPQQIFNDVLQAPGSEVFHCCHNRREAIIQACDSDAGLIVVAGKGHENYQEIAAVKHDFSDAEVLMSLGFSKAGGQHA